MARIIDLTHPMGSGMPVYPGTEPPVFKQATSIQVEGFAEQRLTLLTHTGTHLDVPAHMLPEGPTLSNLPPERFMGPGCVLDLRGVNEIRRADLEPYAPALARSAFAILRTGWEEHWANPEYFRGFPVLDQAAAAWLTGFGLSGIGLDAISVDSTDSSHYPVHHLLFEAGLVIVENLCNLGALPASGFEFQALPLPIQNGDGSPVRAVAVITSHSFAKSPI
ncbi:MAG: cyclase family protein [Proteobacteria bacterium]|nr:cyclase family protein [Pseudomonadota bacterium]